MNINHVCTGNSCEIPAKNLETKSQDTIQSTTATTQQTPYFRNDLHITGHYSPLVGLVTIGALMGTIYIINKMGKGIRELFKYTE